MWTFSLPPPLLLDISSSVTYINMISSSTNLAYPWIVLDKTEIQSFGNQISLSSIDLDYEAIY